MAFTCANGSVFGVYWRLCWPLRVLMAAYLVCTEECTGLCVRRKGGVFGMYEYMYWSLRSPKTAYLVCTNDCTGLYVCQRRRIWYVLTNVLVLVFPDSSVLGLYQQMIHLYVVCYQFRCALDIFVSRSPQFVYLLLLNC